MIMIESVLGSYLNSILNIPSSKPKAAMTFLAISPIRHWTGRSSADGYSNRSNEIVPGNMIESTMPMTCT